MYIMTKRLLMLFLSILLPVFMIACGSKSTTTSSTFIPGYSAVLSNLSTVRTWGANGFGQLGNGNTSDSHTPVKMAKFSNSLTAIATGGGHVLALDSANNGTVWAWGYNANGQLGNNSTANSAVAVNVLKATGTSTPLSNVMAIAAGSQHSLALDNGGNVWAWGYNGFGQLGNQTTTNSPVPVQVMKTVGGITSPLTGITAVAAGGDFSLALDGNNLVWAWGNNAKGQLGVPAATTTSLTAVQVVGLTGITKIAAGVAHGLALDSTNVLWGWGYNAFGQLGQPVNAANPSFFTAVKITLPLGTVTEISAGSAHSLALIDGSVYAWGYNFYGQLGNGAALKSETPMLTPQLVVMDLNNTTLPGIKSITAIGFHNIAIDGSGNVWTWGFNGYGQLGDGTTTNRSYAQQVIFQ